jgi:hypothetical protein
MHVHVAINTTRWPFLQWFLSNVYLWIPHCHLTSNFQGILVVLMRNIEEPKFQELCLILNPGLQVGPYGYTTTRMIYEQISGDISPLQIYIYDATICRHTLIYHRHESPPTLTHNQSVHAGHVWWSERESSVENWTQESKEGTEAGHEHIYICHT